MKMLKVKGIVVIGLIIAAICVLLSVAYGFITMESIGSLMAEFNKLFPNVSSGFIAAITTLIGVFVGWFLANRTEQKRLRVLEIRNELEKAYGTLYSMVSRPEEMVKVDNESNQLGVVVSHAEKKELDGIITSYPHMLPQKIVVLWRTEIRDLEPFEVSVGIGEIVEIISFAIPVEFKEEIIREYEQRLEEYYKIVERWKNLKKFPIWVKA